MKELYISGGIKCVVVCEKVVSEIRFVGSFVGPVGGVFFDSSLEAAVSFANI